LESADVLKQTVDEPLYAITLKTDIINATNMEDEKDTINIESGKIIYAFYNDIVNKNEFL
jgi:predicted NACHT family NTPase